MSVELFQTTDSLGLSQKERGEALPHDVKEAIIKSALGNLIKFLPGARKG